MNRKAFTLVELLGVIIILGLLALIIIPTVNNTIKDNKEKLYNQQIDNIEKVANMWGLKNTGLLGDNAYYLTFQTLQADGFIKDEDIINPMNDERFVGCVEIKWSSIYNQYEYKYVENVPCINEIVTPEEPIYSSSVQALMDNVVTTGDGLYLEDEIYRYKGSNPANYIRLFDGNNGVFRIISISEQGIKVISNQYITMAFDSGNKLVTECTSNPSECPRNNDNNTFCKVSTGTYNGCNVWNLLSNNHINGDVNGTVTNDSEVKTYLENTYYSSLNSISNKIVENATWNIGQILWSTSKTIEDLKNDEDNAVWIGKIGLINPSDYVMAQLPGTSSNNCVIKTLENSTCAASNTNWLKATNWYWTINALTPSTTNVFRINVAGSVNSVGAHDSTGAVRPVLYLKTNISLGNESGVDAEHAMTILP